METAFPPCRLVRYQGGVRVDTRLALLAKLAHFVLLSDGVNSKAKSWFSHPVPGGSNNLARIRGREMLPK